MTDLALVNGLAGLALGCLFMALGAALILRSAKARKSQREHRLALARPPDPRLAAPRTLSAAGDGTQAINARTRSPEFREMARLLARFGIPARRAASVYLWGRAAIAVGGGAIALFLTLRLLPGAGAALAAPLMLAAALAAWLVPGVLLGRLVRARAASAAEGLPDALELLMVCVEAGLSLEDGVARAVAELAHSRPALAEELALTAADLRILPSRDQALANLAERLNVPSVRSLVTTLSQTLRYGTPLAQAMRNLAIELRADSLLRIEERANELPVMLTIPMMLFIMPTIFLIVGGPAGLRIVDIFLR